MHSVTMKFFNYYYVMRDVFSYLKPKTEAAFDVPVNTKIVKLCSEKQHIIDLFEKWMSMIFQLLFILIFTPY